MLLLLVLESFFLASAAFLICFCWSPRASSWPPLATFAVGQRAIWRSGGSSRGIPQGACARLRSVCAALVIEAAEQRCKPAVPEPAVPVEADDPLSKALWKPAQRYQLSRGRRQRSSGGRSQHDQQAASKRC